MIRLRNLAGLVLAGPVVALTTIGCDSTPAPPPPADAPTRVPALAALGTEIDQAVLAQGQLKPAGGVLAIPGPPGDRLESLEVQQGDQVQAGQVLGRLASQAAREGELAVARAKRQEAETTAEAEQRVAMAKLDVAKIELEKARLKLQQAKDELRIAEENGGRLGLLQQELQLAENKLQQMRSAAEDPTGGRLITSSNLEQQQLAVDQARADLAAARAEARSAIDAGELAVRAAEQELRAAEVAIESGKAALPLASLDEQLKLLELQLASSRLVSPSDGTVVAVHQSPGQPTTGQPILQIADLSEMICEAEVNVSQLAKIRTGARATITSPAFEGALEGTVQSISRLIGSPQLPNANPMARVDYRSGRVTIQIKPEDVARAAQLIHLQVDVAIARED